MSPKKSKAKPKKKARAVKKTKKVKASKKARKARPKKVRATRKTAAARRKPAKRKVAKKKAPPRAKKKPAAKARKKTPGRSRKGVAAKKKVTVKAKPARKAAGKGAPAPVVVKSVPAPAEATKTKVKTRKGRSRRSSRRAALIRRGPDGEILAPGDLLLPGGAKGPEEIAYLFRGCMAAERPVSEEAITEVLTKRGVPEGPGEREELERALAWARERFGGGDVEPVIPVRSNLRRTFEGVVDRARQRRREIGAFLRGLDMGHTETSHMDAHGEASLQSLMEWAARLENLVENLEETPDTNQGHYAQFHRVLDQLESTTEALVIDVEQTLRRLRDRLRR
jgi:hypothetical protein